MTHRCHADWTDHDTDARADNAASQADEWAQWVAEGRPERDEPEDEPMPTPTDLLPAPAGPYPPDHPHWGRRERMCQLCGMHAGLAPGLVIDRFGRCPACAAEWLVLETRGLSGRRLIAAWNARRIVRTAERIADARARRLRRTAEQAACSLRGAPAAGIVGVALRDLIDGWRRDLRAAGCTEPLPAGLWDLLPVVERLAGERAERAA